MVSKAIIIEIDVLTLFTIRPVTSKLNVRKPIEHRRAPPDERRRFSRFGDKRQMKPSWLHFWDSPKK